MAPSSTEHPSAAPAGTAVPQGVLDAAARIVAARREAGALRLCVCAVCAVLLLAPFAETLWPGAGFGAVLVAQCAALSLHAIRCDMRSVSAIAVLQCFGTAAHFLFERGGNAFVPHAPIGL